MFSDPGVVIAQRLVLRLMSRAISDLDQGAVQGPPEAALA